PNVRKAQSEFDRIPKKRQILRRHRHGQGDRKIHLAANFNAAPTGSPQVRAAKEFLPLFLRTVKLQVKLEGPITKCRAQLTGESGLLRNAHTVSIQQNVIDVRMVL